MGWRSFAALVCAFYIVCTGAALAESATTSNMTEVEAYVRAEFSDIPVMISIAECESKMRQYADSGAALRGGAGNAMIGVFQIHENAHRAFADSRGMDIDTIEGNVAYARYLYQTEGTKPWLSSSSCWQSAAMTINAIVDPGTVVTPGDVVEHQIYVFDEKRTLTETLRMGDEGLQVRTLQKMLNDAGFTLAESGPGSPGNETSRFGALTRGAVKKLQCHSKIVCDGNESTTGFGLVGPRTRAALMQFARQNVVVQPSPIVISLPKQGTNQVPAATSTTASSTATASAASSITPQEAAEISRLQAQIQELQKRIAELMDS